MAPSTELHQAIPTALLLHLYIGLTRICMYGMTKLGVIYLKITAEHPGCAFSTYKTYAGYHSAPQAGLVFSRWPGPQTRDVQLMMNLHFVESSLQLSVSLIGQLSRDDTDMWLRLC